MSPSFESLVHSVDEAWNFSNRRYQAYPKHAVVQQEFELQHCANHIGASAGRLHAHLERIDHEGIALGITVQLADDLAKLITAALKMSQVLKMPHSDLAEAIVQHAK